MILIFGALFLMVGAIASLALGSWWILVAAMAVHGLLSAIVIAYAWNRAEQSYDKPDPIEEARVEDEEDSSRPPLPGRRPRDREVFN